MTKATQARLARLYESVIGYDPSLEGWTLAEQLESLRWIRTALCLCNGDPTAYTGETLTSAQLRAL